MNKSKPFFFDDHEEQLYNQNGKRVSQAQQPVRESKKTNSISMNQNFEFQERKKTATVQNTRNVSQPSIFQSTPEKNQDPVIERLQKQYGKKVIKTGDNQYKILDEPFNQRSQSQNKIPSYNYNQKQSTKSVSRYMKKVDQYGNVKYIPLSDNNIQKPQPQQQQQNNRYNISQLNDKFDGQNIADKFWQQKEDEQQNPNKFDVLNKIIKDNRSNTVISPDQNHNNVFISQLKNTVTDLAMNEEDYYKNKSNPMESSLGITDSIIGKIKRKVHLNCLDDLQQLIQNSKEYENAKKSLKDGKFTDPTFPPNQQSIIGYGERRMDTRSINQIQWLRPNEFMKPGYQLYRNIKPFDIFQGNLGNCYFLAAASSIAEYHERLERNFLVKAIDNEGIYVVAICWDGIWEDIVIDDLIPCKDGEPFFNRTKSSELWVSLLEKAWAKTFGGYMNTEAGLTREALRDLTGACCKTFMMRDPKYQKEFLWESLKEAEKNDWIITAGSDDLNNGSDEYIAKIGIAGSHAYSLLSVHQLNWLGGDNYEIDTKNSPNSIKIVKLRNPWGQNEWMGSWSDKDTKWQNQDLLRMLDHQQKENDGVFFMEWKDFLQYYSDFQICYYHDMYDYSAIALQSEQNQALFLKFEIKSPGKYYFSLNQQNCRRFRQNENYCYSDCSFALARQVDEQNYDYIGGNMKRDKENWIVADIVAGTYIVSIRTPWISFIREFSFSIYGPSKTMIQTMSIDDAPKHFIKNLFLAHAEKHNHQWEDFKGYGQPDIKFTCFNNNGGYAYMLFKNFTKNIQMQATIEFLGSENIKIMEPYSGLRPSIYLEPGETILIPIIATQMPYKLWYRILSAFKDMNFRKNIKQKVKESSIVIQKQFKGQKVDIKTYYLEHNEGFAMLYVNNTKQYTLKEELVFDLKDCHIESVYGNYISVVIKPQSEHLVEIIKDEDAQSFSCSIQKLHYKVNPVQFILQKLIFLLYYNMHKNKFFIHQLLPNLTYNMYKGQNGKFGNIGGSLEYIGAPHYVSLTQLKCVCQKGR